MISTPISGGTDSFVTLAKLFPEGYRPYDMDLVRRRSSANKFTVVSTFSGGGGSSTGYRLAGARVIAANEFVPEAARTYSTNFADSHLDPRDIRDLNRFLDTFKKDINIETGELDLIEGSPPCSEFSSVGSGISDQGTPKNYSDTKQKHIATLMHDWADTVLGLEPKTIAMENVPEILTTGGEIFEGACCVLRAKYYVHAQVLASNEFGVPQRRRRAILIGIRHDVAKSVGISTDKDVARVFPTPPNTVVTIRGALSELRQSATDVYPFEKAVRISALAELIAKIPKEPSKHMRLRNVSPGETRHFTLVRSSWDLPSLTLTASGQKPNGLTGVFHPLHDRKFTIPELKRLASLPDDFVLTGTLSQAAERICRMVPPLLTAAIGESIYEKVLKPYGDRK